MVLCFYHKDQFDYSPLDRNPFKAGAKYFYDINEKIQNRVFTVSFVIELDYPGEE